MILNPSDRPKIQKVKALYDLGYRDAIYISDVLDLLVTDVERYLAIIECMKAK